MAHHTSLHDPRLDQIFYFKNNIHSSGLNTVCPRSHDPLYVVSYHSNRVKTYWTYSSWFSRVISELGPGASVYSLSRQRTKTNMRDRLEPTEISIRDERGGSNMYAGATTIKDIKSDKSSWTYSAHKIITVSQLK